MFSPVRARLLASAMHCGSDIEVPSAGGMTTPAISDCIERILGDAALEVCLQVSHRDSVARRRPEQTYERPRVLDSLRENADNIRHTGGMIRVRMRERDQSRCCTVVVEEGGAVSPAANAATIDDEPVVGWRANSNELSGSRSEHEHVQLVRSQRRQCHVTGTGRAAGTTAATRFAWRSADGTGSPRYPPP